MKTLGAFAGEQFSDAKDKEYFINWVKDEIRLALRTSVETLSFLKKDGTIREITCTLMPEHLPELPEDKKDKPARHITTDALSVFDIDIKEWRSFNTSNLIYET